MLNTHLKLAFRNLFRHRKFTAINLLGLTLSTMCCLYIVLYVLGHYGYDQHHQDAEQLYRVTGELKIPGEPELIRTALSSPPVAPALVRDFPEVLASTRVTLPLGADQQMLKVGNYATYHDPGYYVDSTFFEVFDYEFVAGDPRTALNKPFSVVISEELATQLFGNKVPLGETIIISDNEEGQPFEVGGVFNKNYGKTHLKNDLFLTLNSGGLGQFIRTNNTWGGNNFLYTYARLRPGASADQLAAKLPDFLERYGGDQLREMGMEKSMHLQAVTDIHLGSNFPNDVSSNTSASFLHLLLMIAGFIQLVACINFMNLTTARATRRAQEVGIRKIVGAQRFSLFSQFLVESVALAAIAVGIALPLTHFLLPWFNGITGVEVYIPFNGITIGILLGLILLTGLLAGLYPAGMLSAFRPAQVLKGGLFTGKSWIRRGLVIGQMVIATGLIMGALTVHQQVQYLLEKDLGFDAQQKIVLNLVGTGEESSTATVRTAIQQLPEVRTASLMSSLPGQPFVSDALLYREGQTTEEGTLMSMHFVDQNYLSTLGIDLLTGRDFTITDTATEQDNYRVIINEAALRAQGIELENALGMAFNSQWGNDIVNLTVVGVLPDIHLQSLAQQITPSILIAGNLPQLNYLVADVTTNDYGQFLASVERVWNQQVPNLPFRYSFLEDDIAQLYESERVLSRLIGSFTLLAIIIACLGMFGLSVYAAEQRQKEISIRKVLGASVQSLVGLLSKEFVLLVGIALAIATPLAYYFLNQWLAEFAYHTTLSAWVFALTSILTVTLALFTISFQSLRAALANPADRLRSE